MHLSVCLFVYALIYLCILEYYSLMASIHLFVGVNTIWHNMSVNLYLCIYLICMFVYNLSNLYIFICVSAACLSSYQCDYLFVCLPVCYLYLLGYVELVLGYYPVMAAIHLFVGVNTIWHNGTTVLCMLVDIFFCCVTRSPNAGTW